LLEVYVQTTVALVDDHRLFREGVVALLSAHPDLKVVGEASNRREALDVVSATSPDVVVLDLSLPGASGIDIAKELLQRRPEQRMLALTMLRDKAHVRQALDAGFLGYAIKDEPAHELVRAIRAVSQGLRYLAPGISGLEKDEQTDGSGGVKDGALLKLTPREREIFDLTVAGIMTAEIAKQLSISRRTVETHRARILHKLGAHSAVDLVRLAARLGLIGPA
jgi:DNA-binding NarL/FixJ family response regulator